ncbi:MAG: Vps62-related protein, partial [Chloroflexota bacterium]|nr:Vps62-related protein [Chloroflexota bacterium]
ATPGPELTAEEELVRRYAPVMYVKRQPEPCDASGEQFLPAPVEVVFGDDEVALRQAPHLPPVSEGIEAGDLFHLDASHYIDLPGHPRTPGCGYESHFKQRLGEQPPVIYAHITREAGEAGLAIQYWFFYYFNEFNDKHEGDWEMIQLLFDDANTPLEAMLSGPTRVAYAQHSGGEPANWEDAKLDKEDGRPVVYVASGSHASFYGPGIWLGWGKDGAGLGCDITTGPSDRVDPDVRLIPATISGPDDPFAWATFRGRWGERDSWVYNGPNGPNLNLRWTEPVIWQESARAGSVRLQSAEALGPQPTGVFCDLAEGLSLLFTLVVPYPWVVGGGLLAAAVIAGLFLLVAKPIIGAAWSLYWRRARFFFLLSAVLVPFTVLFNGFLYVLNRDERLGDLLGVTDDSAIIQLAASVALTGQQLALMLLVGPAVVHAVGELAAGREPTFRGAFRVAFDRFWAVAGAIFRATLFTVLMAITIVGIPWAVMWSIRWVFGTQTTILEEVSGRTALRASSAVVTHHWWRAFMTNAVLVFLGAALGPIVGLALLIGLNVPQDITNGISSTIYAIIFPFAVIGMTVLYLRLKAEPAPAPVAVAPSSPAPGTVVAEPA